jgi:hypothetical protein
MHHDLSFSQDNNDHTIRLNLLQITVRVIAHQGAFMNFWHHKSILSKLPNCYKWFAMINMQAVMKIIISDFIFSTFESYLQI